MPTYYKYAERTADSYVNWAKIGSDISTMLTEEVKRRDDLKTQLEESNRKAINELNNSPQGTFQSGNNFIAAYADDAKKAQLMDYNLLKSGKLDPKQYTRNTQNRSDGTKVLFDLQKQYQSVYEERMKGVQSGDLQALNISNLASVEGFADFSSSKAIINPLDGSVSVARMKPNPKTGIMEISGDVIDVNILRGKIGTEIKAYKVYDALETAKKRLGTEINTIQNMATLSKTGSVTKLIGVKALKGYEKFKPVVDEFEKAMNGMVESMLVDPYHVTSVLTQNVGGYNAESYTYNKDEAAKDPSKILLTINKSSGLPTLDESGPNYKKQKEEAKDWIKTQFMSMLDRGVTVDTTSQLHRNDAPQYIYEAGKSIKEAGNMTSLLGSLWGGSDSQIASAVSAFRDAFPEVSSVVRRKSGVDVTIYNPTTKTNESRFLSFYAPGSNKPMTQKEFILSAAPLLTRNPDVKTAVDRGGYLKDAGFNYNIKDFEAAAVPVGQSEQPVTYTSFFPYMNTGGQQAGAVQQEQQSTGTITGGNVR